MKRIFPWLLFATIMTTLLTLAMALERRESDVYVRAGLWAAIGVLTAWKFGERWKRRQSEARPDLAASPGDGPDANG